MLARIFKISLFSLLVLAVFYLPACASSNLTYLNQPTIEKKEKTATLAPTSTIDPNTYLTATPDISGQELFFEVADSMAVNNGVSGDAVFTLKRSWLITQIIKRRYSGFYNTDLEVLLRCLQVDTVVVTGIITDGCVLMTAMDAHARDFYLRVVMDATSTTDDEAHQAALRIMARTQPGELVNSEEAIELLSG